MSSRALLMLTMPGKVVLKSSVELKTLEVPRSEGFAVHSKARKVMTRQGKDVSSIVSGQDHDFPRTCSHQATMVSMIIIQEMLLEFVAFQIRVACPRFQKCLHSPMCCPRFGCKPHVKNPSLRPIFSTASVPVNR